MIDLSNKTHQEIKDWICESKSVADAMLRINLALADSRRREIVAVALIEQLLCQVRAAEAKERQWFDGEKWIELDPAEVKRRREEAGRTLAKLPKTRDGVPITPGMELFSTLYDGSAHAELRWPFDQLPICAVEWSINLRGDEVWSTREAAQAEQKPGGDPS